MTLLDALLTLRDREHRTTKAVREAEKAIYDWASDRMKRPIVEPRTRQDWLVPEELREDVVHEVVLGTFARLGRPRDILDCAIGVDRKRPRHGGPGTPTFLELGVLDPAVVLGPADARSEALAVAIVEAEKSVGSYLATSLVRRYLSLREDDEAATTEPARVTATKPTAEESSTEEQLERARRGAVVREVRAVLDRAFERQLAAKKLDDVARAETRARYATLCEIGDEELSIEAVVVREIAATAPTFATTIAQLTNEVEGAFSVVEAELPEQSEVRRLVDKVRQLDSAALAKLLRAGDGESRYAAVRAAARALLAEVKRCQATPTWKTVRFRVDQRHVRLRGDVRAGIEGLAGLPAGHPEHLTPHRAEQAHRAADALLMQSQKRAGRASKERVGPNDGDRS